MKKLLRIGVKFCGNCNPKIPGGEIFREIKDKAQELLTEAEFVSADSTDIGVMLVISGCPVDCATRPQGSYPEVVVAGESVNMTDCAADQISGCVLQALLSQIETNK